MEKGGRLSHQRWMIPTKKLNIIKKQTQKSLNFSCSALVFFVSKAVVTDLLKFYKTYAILFKNKIYNNIS